VHANPYCIRNPRSTSSGICNQSSLRLCLLTLDGKFNLSEVINRETIIIVVGDGLVSEMLGRLVATGRIEAIPLNMP
jgi:hypothetical protein